MKIYLKNRLLFILSVCISMSLLSTSCYKDKGNYEYNMPVIPIVEGLDTLYSAYVGDSLIISPTYKDISPDDIECSWEIAVPEAINPDQYKYSGKSLRTIFGLQAKLYNARMTLTNKANGIKYFHDFKIQGNTEFSTGTLVLSLENGKSQLSFIKPNGDIQPRIYESINLQSLPDNPLSIHYLTNKFTGNTPLGYWIITRNGGVRLNVNNLVQEELKPGTLEDNFFLAPTPINVGSLQMTPNGVLMGVINGKFYGGTTNTWDQANTYGMFGAYADGDYELHDKFILTNVNDNLSMIAFEKNKKQFIRLNNYGSPMYFGTQYSVMVSDIFDPTNLGLELLHIVQINNTDTYAYVKDQAGVVFELKFNVNFNGPFTFTPIHKKQFSDQQIINPTSKIIATRTGFIFIANGNKVYRYTPLNGTIIEIDNKFQGNVSMLKLSSDEQTLIVASGSSLFYTNISTGNNGSLLEKIEGIPGTTIDITWR
jgi:hypothetical protein